MGFDALDNAITTDITLTAADLAFSDEVLSDEAARTIVLADVNAAEAYMQSKGLVAAIDAADDLYRGVVKPRAWPNGKPRSSLSQMVILEAVEKILPAIHLSLWAGKADPFALTPKGKTTPAQARAKSHILSWAVKQAGLKEATRLAMKNCLLYGYTICNWGWEDREKRVKKYSRDETGKIVSKMEVEQISQPVFTALNPRRVLVDPACDSQDVRRAKFVVFQSFVTANELDDLRDDPGYRGIPSREQLVELLVNHGEPTTDSMVGNKQTTWRDMQAERDAVATSADVLMQPLELLEYWTEDRVITLLQRKVVIRNAANEFCQKTQVSCSFVDVLGSFFGFGIAKLLAAHQKFQTGVINMWVDSLALTLNPSFQLIKGIGSGSQSVSLSPGKIVTEAGELKQLSVASISGEALNAISASSEYATKLVGANSGSGMPDQALRTARGIDSYAGDVMQKLQYFIENFVDLIFVPTLEQFLSMSVDKLTPEQMQDILSEADGKNYEGDILDVMNAQCGVEILAGTKLTAKAAMAQLFPQIVQMVTASAMQDSLVTQGNKFDYKELLSQYLDYMGLDINDLIVPMTQEDLQRQQAQSQAAQAQSDMALQAQKHQQDLESINEKGTVQAGVSIVKQATKAHMDSAQAMIENSGILGGPNGQ